MRNEDIILLERWRTTGDAEAFNRIVSEYTGMVYATALRILRNATDAEDVTQEAFLRLARDADAKWSLGPWLHRVAANKALSLRKSELRRAARESTVAVESKVEFDPEWAEISRYVDEAIMALPERQRVVIVGHFLEGKTHQTLADALHVSRPAVSKRIDRGVQRIREELRQRGIIVSVATLAVSLGNVSAAPIPNSLQPRLARIGLAGRILPPRPSGMAVNAAVKICAAVLVAIALAATLRWTNPAPDRRESVLRVAPLGVDEDRAEPTLSVPDVESVLTETQRLLELDATLAAVSTRIHGRVFDSISGNPVEGITVVAAPHHALTRIIDHRLAPYPSTAQLSDIGSDAVPIPHYDPEYTDVITIPDGRYLHLGISDDRGYYEALSLAPDEYVIVALPGGEYGGSYHQIVELEESAELEVSLPAIAYGALRIHAYINGKPLAEHSIGVAASPARADFKDRTLRTDANGVAMLEGLFPYTGSVRGYRHGGNTKRDTSPVALTIESAKISEVDLHFTTGDSALLLGVRRTAPRESIEEHLRSMNLTNHVSLFHYGEDADAPEWKEFRMTSNLPLEELVAGTYLLVLPPRVLNEDNPAPAVRIPLEAGAGEITRYDIELVDTRLRVALGPPPIDRRDALVFAVYEQDLDAIASDPIAAEYAIAAMARPGPDGFAEFEGLLPGAYSIVVAEPRVESRERSLARVGVLPGLGRQYVNSGNRVVKSVVLSEEVPDLAVEIAFN